MVAQEKPERLSPPQTEQVETPHVDAQESRHGCKKDDEKHLTQTSLFHLLRLQSGHEDYQQEADVDSNVKVVRLVHTAQGNKDE